MRFADWLITEQTISIPISRLYGWTPKIEEVIRDLQDGRLSHSMGTPIIVSRLDHPRGSFFMMDGYHRVFQAMQSGASHVEGTVSIHVPRIERTGGAHAGMVNNKIRLIDVLDRLP